jgi:hypothetical protein
MAHFAELDNNNIVQRVIVVSNADMVDSAGVEHEALAYRYAAAGPGSKPRTTTTFAKSMRALATNTTRPPTCSTTRPHRSRHGRLTQTSIGRHQPQCQPKVARIGGTKTPCHGSQQRLNNGIRRPPVLWPLACRFRV